MPEPKHAAILLLNWQSAHSATRIHHTRCEGARDLPCAAAKGAECDACMSPQEHVVVVPGRVVDAVRRAAVSNTVLPSVFERKCGFAARGKSLFSEPVFNSTHVAAQEETALSMLKVMDLLECVWWHTRNTFPILSAGLQQSGAHCHRALPARCHGKY